MTKSVSALLALLLLCQPTAGAAQDHGPKPVRIVVDANFLTRVSHFVAGGAFVDEGSIDFNDLIHKPAGAAERVTGPLVGNRGRIDLKFVVVYKQDPSIFGQWKRSATWQITGGTEAYAGMTGHGHLEGTLNEVTGAVHDEFEGKVFLPK